MRVSKELKPIRLETEVIEYIQGQADTYFEGNFTKALEEMLNQSMAIRSLGDGVLHTMYSSVSNNGEFRHQGKLRNLIDGLGI